MQHKALIDVRGMTCSSCASGIGRHLEKKGLTDVRVFYDSGELEAILPEDWDIQKLISELEFLGYSGLVKGSESNRGNRFEFIQSLEFKLLISAICTIPLIAHMFFHWELLHLPTIQFLLCLPVMIIGWFHFGRSAWGAVRSGTSNMDVLISIGSGSAFVYSCIVWWFPHAFK